MKVLSVVAVLVTLVVAIQASALKELVRELLELSDVEERGVYMVRTKDGAIKGELQTINPSSCSTGCVFKVTIKNTATGQQRNQEVTYPGTFEFSGLSQTDVYEVKACEKNNLSACGAIIYCTLNTGNSYTTNHGCTTTPPASINNIKKSNNDIISQIQDLLEQLKE